MRVYPALIVEHDDERLVGKAIFYKRPKALGSKNELRPVQVYNEEAGDYQTVGKEVSLGHMDFESEQAFDDLSRERLHSKLREIERKWLEQADIADSVYGDEDEEECDEDE